MGGCVTKNGAAASAAGDTEMMRPSPASKRGKNTILGDSTTEDSGGSLTPTSMQQQPQLLKEKERRRLSLSQSGPVRDENIDEFRGQLMLSPPNGVEQLDGSGTTTTTAAGDADIVCYHTRSEEEENNDQARMSRLSTDTFTQQLTMKTVREPSLTSTGKNCRHVSVAGIPSVAKQDNFEEVKSDTGQFNAATLVGLGIGYTCKKGLKPESPNQDDFFIVRVADWGLYGVFDGHGPYGHNISNFVQRELPKIIYNDSNFVTNPKEALRNSFIMVHDMLENAAATTGAFDCSLSGTTATVVLHRKSSGKLYIAHVGDSRCILGRLQKDGSKLDTVNLTTDHKPNCEMEKKRIQAAGGQVRRLEGDIPHRVFVKGRLYPGLAMSRAIGDSVGRQAGVICEPDVLEYTLDPERDMFICLCSDGVWEFFNSDEVADLISSHGPQGVQAAADMLAQESWNRWIQEEGNVVDDITVEIIFLNPDLAANSS